MKLIPQVESTTILIKGRVGPQFTTRSLQVIGDDIVYKTECIIKAIYKNTRLDDPFGTTKLHVFSIYVNNVKMSTPTHISLDEYCNLFKDYINFERWNDVL